MVEDVEGTLGGSRLVVAAPRGEVLIPLVAAICTTIDPAAKRIVDRSARRAARIGTKSRIDLEQMTFDIVTIFPAMFEQPLAAGVIGRAIERGMLDVKVRDLRDFTTDRHRVVDDVPYGGGPGMVLKADPMFRALDAIEAERGKPLTVVLTSPQGPPIHAGDGAAAERAGARRDAVRPVRGRGRARPGARDRGAVDRRLRADRRGAAGAGDPRRGRAAACPGVVGDEQSVVEDSFSRGLLDFPQYTRPATLTWSARRARRTCGAGRAAVGQPRARFGAGGSAKR